MAITIVQAARLIWCPGLAQLTGKPQGGLHEWLANGTYAPALMGQKLLLSGIDTQHLLRSFGADINRLSSAASETLRNITEVKIIPKSLAWPYVKLYYASLFYVHAVLRIWGRSPSYFRTEELMRLRDTLKAYGVQSPFKVTTGQYLIEVDATNGSVTMAPETGSSGTHDAAWQQFHRALGDLASLIERAQYLEEDTINIGSEVQRFASLISKGGNQRSWPSQMRNNIQYRQAEGVWYPYIGKAKTSSLQQDVEAIIDGNGELSKILSPGENDLSQFRSACCSIICFARDVIDDMSSIGGAKSFLRYGQRHVEYSATLTCCQRY